MTERPILFSGPMVRAILDGRKTQTRRVFKLPRSMAWHDELGGERDGWVTDGNGWWSVDELRCPYGIVGDRLWVREAWCQRSENGRPVYNAQGNLDCTCVHFQADGEDVVCLDEYGFREFNKDGSEKSPWRPSIHMPRWASRITLDIVGIRIERLDEISEADALSEGVGVDGQLSAVERFANLWVKINGAGSFDANPLVWVIEFRMVNE